MTMLGHPHTICYEAGGYYHHFAEWKLEFRDTLTPQGSPWDEVAELGYGPTSLHHTWSFYHKQLPQKVELTQRG